MTNTIKVSHSIRANKYYSKEYLAHIFNDFAPIFAANLKADRQIDVVSIDFGKQDMRGSPSITVFDKGHCVPEQRHFASNAELVAYVRGYLDANRSYMA